MTQQKIIIFAGYEIENHEWAKAQIGDDDLIICADSGVRHARALDLTPHHVVGDFDSVTEDDLQWAKDHNNIQVHHVADQDKNDLQKALDLTLENTTREILILGALGGRLDHQFANILLLERYPNISRIALKTHQTHARLLDQSFTFEGRVGDKVGVIPLRDTNGLRYEGLKYPAEGLPGPTTLGWLGTSNELTQENAAIHFDVGLVLLIHERKS